MFVLFSIFTIYMLVIFGCLAYMFFFDKKSLPAAHTKNLLEKDSVFE